MNGNKLEEFAQEYSVNYTLCEIIITTNLDFECIVSYNLRQIYSEMIINKYKSDVKKVENARHIIKENEAKLLSIILDFWEKTNSEELIFIIDEVYQENIEMELVKSEIFKELTRKRKMQKKYTQELGITPLVLSK
ncbi:7975_t:CDS:2, partial [Funneliformis geosporum]